MIPTELTEQAEAQGIRCWCGYGLTELASTVCAKRADGRPGVGVALAGRQVKLVDDEVWIKADCLAAGYWQQGQLLPLTDSDGWFHTRIAVGGSKANYVFSGGWIICFSVVARDPARRHRASFIAVFRVQHAFVIPVADAEFGHRPVAVIDSADEVDVVALADWLAHDWLSSSGPLLLSATHIFEAWRN